MERLINKLLMECLYSNCGGPIFLIKYKGVKLIRTSEAYYLIRYNEEAAKVLEIIDENNKKIITTNISVYKSDEEEYMINMTKTNLNKPGGNRITEETTMYKYENDSLSKLDDIESLDVLLKKHKEAKDKNEIKHIDGIERIRKYIVEE